MLHSRIMPRAARWTGALLLFAASVTAQAFPVSQDFEAGSAAPFGLTGVWEISTYYSDMTPTGATLLSVGDTQPSEIETNQLISIPASAVDPRLTFSRRLDLLEGDEFHVHVKRDGETGWTQVFSVNGYQTNNDFHVENIPLSNYIGDDIHLRFSHYQGSESGPRSVKIDDFRVDEHQDVDLGYPYLNDMEAAQGLHWKRDGLWHVASGNAYSGTLSLDTNPNGEIHPLYWSASAQTLDAILIPADAQLPTFRYRAKFELLNGDYFKVYAREEGQSWVQLKSYALGHEHPGDYQYYEHSLDDFVGKRVQLRFYLQYAGNTGVRRVQIDDIEVADRADFYPDLSYPFSTAFDTTAERAQWSLYSDHGFGTEAGQSYPARSGTHYLHNNPGAEALPSQTGDAWLQGWIPVPADAITPTLSFWTRVEYPVNATAYAEVQRHGSRDWDQAWAFGGTHNFNGWRRVNVDLSAYKGDKIRIKFRHLHTSSWSLRAFLVDDVSVGPYNPSYRFDYPYLSDFEQADSVHDDDTDTNPGNDVNGRADWQSLRTWEFLDLGEGQAPSGRYVLDSNPTDGGMAWNESVIEQDGFIPIPANAQYPVLELTYLSHMEHWSDDLQVELQREGETQWHLITEFDQTHTRNGYTRLQASLNDHKGHKVRIRFHQHHGGDASLIRDLRLDDIRVGERATTALGYPYNQDFDGTSDEWVMEGRWDLSGDGDRSLDSNPEETDYGRNELTAWMDGWIAIPTDADMPVVRFDYRDQLQNVDRIEIHAQRDDEDTWATVGTLNHYSTRWDDWMRAEFAVDAYKGDNVRFRLRYYTNGSSPSFRRFLLDRFSVGDRTLTYDFDFPYRSNLESSTSTHDDEQNSNPDDDINGQEDWITTGDWLIDVSPGQVQGQFDKTALLIGDVTSYRQGYITMDGWVKIPDSNVSPQLNFAVRGDLANSGDVLKAQVQSADSYDWTNVAIFPSAYLTPTHAWEMKTADLSAYLGKTIRLRFYMKAGVVSQTPTFAIGDIRISDGDDFPDQDGDGIWDELDTDRDGDLIPDLWELDTFQSLDQGIETDYDGDGFSDRYEYDNNTDPTQADAWSYPYTNAMAPERVTEWPMSGIWRISDLDPANGLYALDSNPNGEAQHGSVGEIISAAPIAIPDVAGSYPTLRYQMKLNLLSGDLLYIYAREVGQSWIELDRAGMGHNHADAYQLYEHSLDAFRGKDVEFRFYLVNGGGTGERRVQIDDIEVGDLADFYPVLTYPFSTGFDTEPERNQWNMYSDHGFGSETENGYAARSGTHYLHSNPGEESLTSQTGNAWLKGWIDIPSDATVPTLTFWTRVEYPLSYNAAYVKIQRQTQNTWEQVWALGGNHSFGEWRRVDIDLSQFRGERIRLMFEHLHTSGWPLRAFLVDDVSIGAFQPTHSLDYPYVNDFEQADSIHDDASDTDASNDVNGRADWQSLRTWEFLDVGDPDAPSGSFVLDANPTDGSMAWNSSDIVLDGFVPIPTDAQQPVLELTYRSTLEHWSDDIQIELQREGETTWYVLTELDQGHTRDEYARLQVSLNQYKGDRIRIRFSQSYGGDASLMRDLRVDDIRIGDHEGTDLGYPYSQNFDSPADEWVTEGRWAIVGDGDLELDSNPGGESYGRNELTTWMDGWITIPNDAEIPVLSFDYRSLMPTSSDKAEISVQELGTDTWTLLKSFGDTDDRLTRDTHAEIALEAYRGKTIRFRLQYLTSYTVVPDRRFILDDWYVGDLPIVIYDYPYAGNLDFAASQHDIDLVPSNDVNGRADWRTTGEWDIQQATAERPAPAGRQWRMQGWVPGDNLYYRTSVVESIGWFDIPTWSESPKLAYQTLLKLPEYSDQLNIYAQRMGSNQWDFLGRHAGPNEEYLDWQNTEISLDAYRGDRVRIRFEQRYHAWSSGLPRELLLGDIRISGDENLPDLDADGLPDAYDDDRDGDGVLNDQDAFPDDPNETADLDGDGIGDNADTDKDGDGMLDSWEIANFGDLTRDENTDTDGDGLSDLYESQSGLGDPFLTSPWPYPYLNDFEPGRHIEWSRTGSWTIEADDPASGVYALDSNQQGVNQNWAHSHLEMVGAIPVPADAQMPTLSFRMKFEVVDGDWLYVYARESGETNWTELTRYGVGQNHDSRYERQEISLDAYLGKEVELRFHLAHSGYSGVRRVRLDDIEVADFALPDGDFGYPYQTDFDDLADRDQWTLSADFDFADGSQNAQQARSGQWYIHNNRAGQLGAGHTGEAIANGWINIPAEAALPTLTFWGIVNYATSDVTNKASVQVQREGSRAWETIWEVAEVQRFHYWRRVDVDLDAYKGQRIRLRFSHLHGTGQHLRTFLVDDVSVGPYTPSFRFDYPYETDFEQQASVHDGDEDTDPGNDVNGREDWHTIKTWSFINVDTNRTVPDDWVVQPSDAPAPSGSHVLDSNLLDDTLSTDHSSMSMDGHVPIPADAVYPVLEFSYLTDFDYWADQIRLEIQEEGSADWVQLSGFSIINNRDDYTRAEISLVPYKGKRVRLRFAQNYYNDSQSHRRNLQVDDLRIGERVQRDLGYPYSHDFTLTNDDWILEGRWDYSGSGDDRGLDSNPSDGSYGYNLLAARQHGWISIPADAQLPVFTFDYKNKLPTSDDRLEVQVQTTADDQWVTLADYRQGADRFDRWMDAEVALDAYIGQTVRFRFQFLANNVVTPDRRAIVDNVYVGNRPPRVIFDYPYAGNLDEATSVHDDDQVPSNDVNGREDWHHTGEWDIQQATAERPAPNGRQWRAQGFNPGDNLYFRKSVFESTGWFDVPSWSENPALRYSTILELPESSDKQKVYVQRLGSTTWTEIKAIGGPWLTDVDWREVVVPLNDYQGDRIKIRFEQSYQGGSSGLPREMLLGNIRVSGEENLPDLDGDGLPDDYDDDRDGDGVTNDQDDLPDDPTETTDTDGDGIGDNSDPDKDGDGMLDTWEIEKFGDLSHDQNIDSDGDGLSDTYEYEQGTDPWVTTDWTYPYTNGFEFGRQTEWALDTPWSYEDSDPAEGVYALDSNPDSESQPYMAAGIQTVSSLAIPADAYLPTLRFRMKMDLYSDSVKVYARVEGQSWNQLASYLLGHEHPEDYQFYEFSLDAYKGERIDLRVEFVNGGNSGTGRRVQIDDITVADRSDFYPDIAYPFTASFDSEAERDLWNMYSDHGFSTDTGDFTARSGTHFLHSNPGAESLSSQTGNAWLRGWVSIPAYAQTPTLSFWTRLEYPESGTAYVEVQRHNTRTWTQVWAIGGSHAFGGWRRVDLDLSGYKGDRIRVRFRHLHNSGWSVRAFLVDDVSIGPYTPSYQLDYPYITDFEQADSVHDGAEDSDPSNDVNGRADWQALRTWEFLDVGDGQAPSGAYVLDSNPYDVDLSWQNSDVSLDGYIRIPADAQQPVMEVTYRSTLEHWGDVIKVEVQNEHSSGWDLVEQIDQTSNRDGYSRKQISLHSYKGQNIRVRFHQSYGGGAGITRDLRIDDIRIEDRGGAELGYPYSQNFDSSAGDWVTEGLWDLTGDTDIALDSNPDELSYGRNEQTAWMDGWVSIPTDAEMPVVMFNYKNDFQNGDRVEIQAQRDTQSSWAYIGRLYHSDARWDEWMRAELPLNDYIGDRIRLRVRYYTNGSGLNFRRTLFDNLYIGDRALSHDLDFPYNSAMHEATSTHDPVADTDPTNDVNGREDWTTTGHWGFKQVLDANDVPTGQYALSVGDMGSYEYGNALMDGWVELPPEVSNPGLVYFVKGHLANNNDVVRVQVQAEDSYEWQNIKVFSPFYDSAGEWDFFGHDLSAYSGKRIRVRIFADFKSGSLPRSFDVTSLRVTIGTDFPDLDGDGIPDDTDPDRDGDGYDNALDTYPDDLYRWRLAALSNFNVVPQDGNASLDWSASTDPGNTAGYHVYRIRQSDNQRVQLGGGLLTGLSFLDDTTENGTLYRYEILAVDPAGLEGDSVISDPVFITYNRTQLDGTSSQWDGLKVKLQWTRSESSLVRVIRRVGTAAEEIIAEVDADEYLDTSVDWQQANTYALVPILRFTNPLTSLEEVVEGTRVDLSQLDAPPALVMTLTGKNREDGNVPVYIALNDQGIVIFGNVTNVATNSLYVKATAGATVKELTVTDGNISLELPTTENSLDWTIEAYETGHPGRLVSQTIRVIRDVGAPSLSLEGQGDPTDDNGVDVYPAVSVDADTESYVLNGSASDADSALAEVFVRNEDTGQVFGTIAPAAGRFQGEIPLAYGDNPLTIEAVDRAANSTSVRITLSRPAPAAPELVIHSPGDGDTVETATVTVSGSVHSSQSGENLRIVLGEREIFPSETAEEGRYDFSFSDVPLDEGRNVLSVSVNSEVGSDTVAVSVTRRIPSNDDPTDEAPELTLDATNIAVQTTDNEVRIQGTVVSGTEGVTITVDGQTIDFRDPDSGNGEFFHDIELGGLNDGEYQQVDVTVTDAEGNQTSTTVLLTLDETAPVLNVNTGELQSPDGNGVYVIRSNPLRVHGTVSDARLVGVTVDGSGVPLVPVSGQSNQFSFETYLAMDAATDENLNFTIVAWDAAGNSTSKEYTVRLQDDVLVDIVTPSPDAGFVSTGGDVDVSLLANISSLPTGAKVVIQVEEEASAEVSLNGGLLTETVTVPYSLFDAGEAAIKVTVKDAGDALIANAIRLIKLSKSDEASTDLLLSSHEPVNESAHQEPTSPIVLRFNQTVTEGEVSVRVWETVHTRTYLGRDESGANTLDDVLPSGPSMGEIHHDRLPVSGRLSILHGAKTLVFEADEEFHFDARVFVDVIQNEGLSDEAVLGRFVFDIRPTPTFVQGFAADSFGEPLSGLLVSMPDTGLYAVTDQNGLFSFLDERETGDALSGMQRIVLNPGLANPYFGSVESRMNVRPAEMNTAGVIRTPILNPSVPFVRLRSGGSATPLAFGNLELDLSQSELVFPDNRPEGDVHVQFTPANQLSYPALSAVSPQWLYALQPMGIELGGAVKSIKIKVPQRRGSYEYLPATSSEDPAPVLMLGLDAERMYIVPVAVGKLFPDTDGYRVEAEDVALQRLDFIGYAFVDPDQYALLQQVIDKQISIRELIGGLLQ